MTETPIFIAAEDRLAMAVAAKIITNSKTNYTILQPFISNGSSKLKILASRFNIVAEKETVFLFTDQDDHETCPASIIHEWLNGRPKHHNLLFRVAVMEVESWLLADHKNIGSYLGVKKEFLPSQSDLLKDPKQTLLNLVQKHSTKTALKRDLLPSPGDTRKVGPNYNGPLIKFVHEKWDIHEARRHSKSLDRSWDRLNTFVPRF